MLELYLKSTEQNKAVKECASFKRNAAAHKEKQYRKMKEPIFQKIKAFIKDKEINDKNA